MNDEDSEDFKDWDVWQEGMALVTATYALIKKMPLEPTDGLSIQMRSSAVQIPSKIARLYASTGFWELQYDALENAISETEKLQNLLLHCAQMEYVTREEADPVIKRGEHMNKTLLILKRQLLAEQ
jgi:four helix bundle protein